MASKSSQQDSETAEDIEELLDALDTALDRVKVLYEQYFLGIQKQPPTFIHTDVERKLRDLAQLQIRNTALRYRFVTLQQKYGSYNSYWRRTLRQIENGTYYRNLSKVGRKAIQTGEEIPEEILAAMPKRMREQVRRDREAALAIARRRDGGVPDDELLTLAPEPELEDDAPGFVSEPSELRRNVLHASGLHVIQESEEFDIEAFFASVEQDDEPTDASAGPPRPPSAVAPPAAAAPPSRTVAAAEPPAPPVPAPVAAPGAPARHAPRVASIVPPQRRPHPSASPTVTSAIRSLLDPDGSERPVNAARLPIGARATGPIDLTEAPGHPVGPAEQVPAGQPARSGPRANQPTPPGTRSKRATPAGRTIPAPLRAAPPVAGHFPPAEPPGQARPLEQARPRPEQARQPGPADPPGPAGSATQRVAAARPVPGPPSTPGGTTRIPVPPMPKIPMAPSQRAHPITITPGASIAHAVGSVETMAGPFPREPIAPTEAAPAVAPPDAPPARAAPARSGMTKPVPNKPRSTISPVGAAPPPRQGPPPGMTEADVNALYAKYVKAKEMVGETAGPGAYGKLLRTINDQAPKIMAQYKAKGVAFSIMVKDNQVIIRAKPKT